MTHPPFPNAKDTVQRALAKGLIHYRADVPAVTQTHAQPGEIPFKQWLAETAERLKINPRALSMRLRRGTVKYPEMRRVGSRIIFVKV